MHNKCMGLYGNLAVIYSRLLLNLGKTNIYKHYSWTECVEKEMHWELEKPLLRDIPQMGGRYQPNLVGRSLLQLIGS